MKIMLQPVFVKIFTPGGRGFGAGARGGIFNQMRRGLKTKIHFSQDFFTSSAVISYKFSSFGKYLIFRIKRAGSSNYERSKYLRQVIL